MSVFWDVRVLKNEELKKLHLSLRILTVHKALKYPKIVLFQFQAALEDLIQQLLKKTLRNLVIPLFLA